MSEGNGDSAGKRKSIKVIGKKKKKIPQPGDTTGVKSASRQARAPQGSTTKGGSPSRQSGPTGRRKGVPEPSDDITLHAEVIGTNKRRIPQPGAQSIAAEPGLELRSTGARNAAPGATGAQGANTIVYVHGIGNKPKASVLKCQWDTALFGTQLGDRSRMAYWVNRDFYPAPLDATCAAGDLVSIEDDEASTPAIMALARGEHASDDRVFEREIQALANGNADREARLRAIATEIYERSYDASEEGGGGDHRSAALGLTTKVLPLPAFLRRQVTSQLTRALLRDVNDFLFDTTRREAMERALLDRLSAGGGPFVVIAHSQGSLIAYDVLRRLDSSKIEVPLFVTMGSPLGLAEIQDIMRPWARGRLEAPSCVGRWINVADRLDPVSFDVRLRDDIQGGDIVDISGIGINTDSPRHPHSGTGYLRTYAVRTEVRSIVGAGFHQAIAPFAIAKDLVTDIEDSLPQNRHATLIQLAGDKAPDPTSPKVLRLLAADIEKKIVELVEADGGRREDAAIEKLSHFVSARLTRLEVETLRSLYADLRIDGIWRNAAKRALITDSIHTVQAAPANLGYGADGRKICWAVLDTGIRADHPHFQKHGNVLAQWDCTKFGSPKRLSPGPGAFSSLDGHGHGTHVAGIIAGELEIEGITYSGMAPKALLYGFKVLNDNGDGNDAWIIKALDIISQTNEEAGQLVIQGINLSLGGTFDASVFGCGHTPLCQELRRLWRQGVIICLAAGNEGYAVLATSDGNIQANLDLSIGDPANLEETIAVGSVHKTNPHTYGVSYFSSRGPTADGRRKPDLVAPGEKILSARHDWQAGVVGHEFYVEMSGTSMATPHVSGILAAFLSLRREFISYPDRVKKILLDACVDLGRDPYAQGAGLPNLVKMLG
ncbi:S8 family peptidase [Mesorhizobium sp. ESP6-5]|uniref:S8 family peptidase n=1 Tax=Mesorhizobium sp. ESP6-5 TaxID=2876623 RepID=UPI001CCA8C3C|nr:S8 family peptidase [Mesorhizobium sp. ESP6-5]MBZ9757302.1 S8 family peptidase [Mesorhizobium sp. ESP6-5]